MMLMMNDDDNDGDINENAKQLLLSNGQKVSHKKKVEIHENVVNMSL